MGLYFKRKRHITRKKIIRDSFPPHRDPSPKQQITSKQEKDQQHPINYPGEIGVSKLKTNGSLSMEGVEKRRGLVIWCLGQTNDGVWTKERINRLLDEVVQPDCWHAAALQEIYKLEGDLHKNSNEPLSDIDSMGGERAISEVICYLIEETKKCLLNGHSTAHVSGLFTADNRNGMSQVTSTISTTTPKPITSPKPVPVKVKSKKQKYTLSEKLDRLDQSNFGLEWEANMLFY